MSSEPPSQSTSNPHLQVDLRHQLGSLALDLSFSTTSPWTVLFGPSGSGKSTVLRAIMGLIQPAHAKIQIGPLKLVDTATRTFLPPTARPVRWAAQRSALFPRMTVAQNLAFALTAQDSPTLDAAIDHFRLDALRHKRPAQLSGGERQRIAVIRAALSSRKRLLLLDEPFSGLDAAIRDTLIADLRAWLPDSPILSVTHDVGEAFHLEAEVIRIAEGRILAQGPVSAVLAPERQRLLTTLHSSS